MFTLSLLAFSLAQPSIRPFEFKDGDRVVWIGSTIAEREQRYGYWETALTVANASKNITFRNLGWSGDTVYGDARAGFDTPAKGYERLVSLTLELKPTVLFVSYGANESFDGEAGLARFEAGLNKLLDALKPTNARVVLFAPYPQQAAPGYPEPALANRNIRMYRGVIEKIAKEREHTFADPAAIAVLTSEPTTLNGLHLTEAGYRAGAIGLMKSLGYEFSAANDWERLAPLRAAIVAKNELFFHRWRPQNETYLFGFRKHEQGKNAKEIVEFDPLVAKAEEEIAKLRVALTKSK
jgi:lysophospholipase L1-like esterase